MWMVLLWLIIFAASLVVLIRSSDFFTDAAERIGLSLGFSPFIIGVTIVAVGTSLPELVSSIIAVMSGSSEIVVGNVVGSNIANILLVLGVTAVVAKKMVVARELIRVDLPLLIGATFLGFMMLVDGSFTWPESILCLALLGVYVAYTNYSEHHSRDKEIDAEMKSELSELRHQKLKSKDILILIASAVGIYFGARFTIEGILELSSLIGVATEVFSLSVVALGTSLPELTVTLRATRKKKHEVALGNILGSNIFNILGVLGVAGLFGTLSVSQNIISFSLPVLIFSSLLYVFMTQDKEITYWEGALLLIFYVFFIFRLFISL